MDIVVRLDGRKAFADWGAGARGCAIGAGGIGVKAGEGDPVTPLGIWPLRRVLYRPDRVVAPHAFLRVTEIARGDGWCDAPGDPHYNQQIRFPFASSAERLWREDGLYDVVVPVGFNDAPVVPGQGSAIFLHVAEQDYAPTMGCVALALPDLLEAVAQFAVRDRLIVEG